LQNFAEIAAADDDTDPNNTPPIDIDSDPDSDEQNDGDYEDNATDNTNGDEDDHDPADVFVEFFDLALEKIISPNQSFPVNAGDDVTFTLVITNEGNVDAYDINLVDYIPADMSLNDTDWTEVSGIAYLNNAIIGPLAPGASTTIDITFTIDPNFQGDAITNYAEISGADNDEDPTNDLPTDEDSTPDDTDNGEDEDDHDPETVPVGQIFDLALMKVLTNPNQPYYPGDSVTFTIEVTNQGTIDAYNVQIIDYLPPSTTLADPNWFMAFAGNVAFHQMAGPIPAYGGTATVDITLIIDPNIGNVFSLANLAEITGAEDENGVPQDE